MAKSSKPSTALAADDASKDAADAAGDQTVANPPGAQAASAPAQTPTDLVRVFNKSKKPFTHEIYKGDARGFDPARHISAPQAFATVPRWLAELWLSGYPEDFIAGDDALRSLDPAQGELIAAKEKAATLEAEKASLQAELDEAKRLLAAATGGG